MSKKFREAHWKFKECHLNTLSSQGMVFLIQTLKNIVCSLPRDSLRNASFSNTNSHLDVLTALNVFWRETLPYPTYPYP